MKKKFLDLGKQPITNSFLNKNTIKKNNQKKEFFYNLSVGFNKKNYLVSIMNFVNPFCHVIHHNNDNEFHSGL